MTLLKLIKNNKSLRNFTIIMSFGWFFLIVAFVAIFLTYINVRTEYEVTEMESHYTNTFSDYNNRIKLLTAYFCEHALDLSVEEFDQVAQSVISNNSTISSVSFAPSGVIDFVYPQGSDQIGYDIMQSASIHENSILLDSIVNNSISYQYKLVDNEVDKILVRNPVFVEDEFYGFITFTIDSDEFATAGFTHTSEYLSSAVYTEYNELIYGHDDFKSYTLHNISVDGVTIVLGESIKIDYLLNRGSYLLGFVLFISLSSLLLYVNMTKTYFKYNTAEKELDYLKNYDAQTDLYNVNRLYEDVKGLIDKSEKFYLSFLNLNNIKFINDKFGYKETSKLVLKTSSMIVRVLRNNSTLYRHGGDEYVLVTKTDSKSEITNLLRRIIKIFESDIVSGSIRTRLGIEIGVVQFPDNGYSVEELVKNAHLTASQISTYDKEGFQFYKSDKFKNQFVNQDFDKMVSELNLDLFEVYLMPIVDVHTNQIAGFECLTRVFDDFGEQLHTENVVLSLERHGKIQILDEKVFRKMLMLMKKLNREFPDQDYFLSLNASALSLNDEYVNNVIKMYEAARLKRGQIVLELTESHQVDDYDYLIQLFKKLNDHGIKIGIDDFGSGYSSISYIAKFPVYAIKVDKQYVRDYANNQFNLTLLKTLLSIAKVLGCKLVAEGVDTPDTLEFLKEYDCPFYQGYLFSKGVPYEDAVALVKNSLPKKKSVE